jgi:hypothetical protein
MDVFRIAREKIVAAIGFNAGRLSWVPSISLGLLMKIMDANPD